jgi:hypothetical protein
MGRAVERFRRRPGFDTAVCLHACPPGVHTLHHRRQPYDAWPLRCLRCLRCLLCLLKRAGSVIISVPVSCRPMRESRHSGREVMAVLAVLAVLAVYQTGPTRAKVEVLTEQQQQQQQNSNTSAGCWINPECTRPAYRPGQCW